MSILLVTLAVSFGALVIYMTWFITTETIKKNREEE